MADTFGRYLAHVAPGANSTSNLFRAVSGTHRALASGATQVLLTSNLNHLRREAALRPIYQGPGFVGFWRGAPTGTTAAPTVDDIDWRDRNTTGTANLYIPSVRIASYGAESRMPLLCLTIRWRAATNGGNVGVYMGVARGRHAFPDASSPKANATESNSAFQDLTLTLQLEPEHARDEAPTFSTGAAATTPGATGETFSASWCSIALGFYNSRNQNGGAGDRADVVAISIYLRPPT